MTISGQGSPASLQNQDQAGSPDLVATERNGAPRISILCVTRNRERYLERCLQSIKDQGYPNLEIIIVDNASEDGTAEMVKNRFDEAILIRTHRNIGFFPALNLAVANSTGQLLMTVDDDAYFMTPDGLSRMAEDFLTDPQVAIVTCNIEGPREAPPITVDRFVHVYKTGFAMMRREVVTEWVGHFPDLFFRSAGESYFASALWEMGLTVKQLADVRMFHDMAMQGRSTWDWGFYGLRSQLLLVWMRAPWWWVGPALVGKFFNGLIHFARVRRISEWGAAWTNVWFWIPEALRYRRPISWRTQKWLWKLRREVLPANSSPDRESSAIL